MSRKQGPLLGMRPAAIAAIRRIHDGPTTVDGDEAAA
jgi:hypothetical protein